MTAWTQTLNLTESAGLGDLATGISDLATAVRVIRKRMQVRSTFFEIP